MNVDNYLFKKSQQRLKDISAAIKTSSFEMNNFPYVNSVTKVNNINMQVGETREYLGIKYMCAIGIDCSFCAFIDDKSCTAPTDVLGSCSSTSREDETDVTFVEVNE